MKRFLFKLTIFFLPLVAGAYALDYVITQGLKKTIYKELAAWNDLFDGKINADLIISGSSLAQNQISPLILENGLRCSSYNLGMDGSSFFIQNSRYEAYLKYNSKPRVLVQTIDTGTLTRNTSLFNFQQLVPYLDEPVIFEAARAYRIVDEKDRMIPLHRYIGEYKLAAVGAIEYFGLGKYENEEYKGYQPLEGTLGVNKFEMMTKNGNKLVVEIDKEMVELFESFLRSSKESGVTVYLVYSPILVDNFPFMDNMEEIRGIFREMAIKYDINILDYSDSQVSYRKELFYDGVHLNKEDAEILSRQIVDDLINKYGFKPCTENPQ